MTPIFYLFYYESAQIIFYYSQCIYLNSNQINDIFFGFNILCQFNFIYFFPYIIINLIG